MPGERFWRDDSGRLTFDLSEIPAKDYPATCRSLVDAFGLTAAGELIVGLDAMFWDFRRDERAIGLEWDIWMGFMVVAKSEASEPLVREIAAWLDRGRWGEASGSI